VCKLPGPNCVMLKIGNIEACVIRKPIKNINLRVKSPAGNITISAPIRTSDSVIRDFISKKLNWIKKKQDEVRSKSRQDSYQYITGENHYLWGNPYALEVITRDLPPKVNLNGSQKIIFSVRPGFDFNKRRKVMNEWYRHELRKAAGERIQYWQDLMGIELYEWRIKRMKTRWGTCNIRAKRIWLNLHLAKRPKHCLDFIIVHEMVHLLESKHNDRFKGYMDRFMPDWKERKRELNKANLGY